MFLKLKVEGLARKPSAAFAAAAEMIREFVDDAVKRYPVDLRQLVVMGFSQGGVMAYDLVLRDPERFRALVAMPSWLPNDLANRLEAGKAHGRLPVMVTHGTRDPLIGVDRARDSRDRLVQMGVSPVYREYEMEHSISPDALRDIVGFLEDRAFGEEIT